MNSIPLFELITFMVMMKHFYPYRSGLLKDGPTLIHRAGGLTEWFNKDGNNVNHMQWTSHSPHLNPIVHLWKIWSNTLDLSTLIPRGTEAVLVAHGDTTP